MNGRMALPVCPTPEIQPTEPVKSHLGSTFFEWFTRMGYIGPRSMPMTATAMAFPTSEGTTQIVTSSLRGVLAGKEAERMEGRTEWRGRRR